MMAADVSSVARLLRGEAGKKSAPEIVTMDLLGGCGGAAAAEDEVVDLEVTVPAGWERRLDLLVSSCSRVLCDLKNSLVSDMLLRDYFCRFEI